MGNKLYMHAILVIVAVASAVFVFVSAGNVDKERHIRFNGSFVLIDQEGLFAEVDMLSREFPENEKFMSAIRDLLAGKKYIKSHSIRQSWPNEVIIYIEEILPLALINGNSLMAGDCTVHDYKPGIDGGRLININVSDKADQLHTCEQIKRIAPYLDHGDISRVEILSNDDYRITYGDILFTVSGEDMSGDMGKIIGISRSLVAGNNSFAGVDLRYSSGGAIRPL